MYIPEPFAVTEQQTILAFIKANAFGELVSTFDNRLFATHLPFLLDEGRLVLLAHLAKQNPQWKNIEGQEVLAIFTGPHGYISPQWYHSPGVPTWNYQAVHVYGKCSVFDDPVRLKSVVDTLTAKYEADFEAPWQPEYNEKMLGAIVGLEIQITDIQCKFKLSQNKPADERGRIINGLKERESAALANAMEKVDQ